MPTIVTEARIEEGVDSNASTIEGIGGGFKSADRRISKNKQNRLTAPMHITTSSLLEPR